MVYIFFFFFFFQAEDGIRDGRVTGVQTCALPILNTSRTSRHVMAKSHTGSEGMGPQDTQPIGAAIGGNGGGSNGGSGGSCVGGAGGGGGLRRAASGGKRGAKK